jgi:hypothetical protein
MKLAAPQLLAVRRRRTREPKEFKIDPIGRHSTGDALLHRLSEARTRRQFTIQDLTL